jgi:predicted DNA-binding transcriptional regulator YafY
MLLIDRITRLKQLDRLIRQEQTGSADRLAKQFHISRRQFYYLLDNLKGGGAEIEYDSIRCTYRYLNDFEL